MESVTKMHLKYGKCDQNASARAGALGQQDWRNFEGMNRVTAWYFMRQLHARLLEPPANPTVGRGMKGPVDILVTGCEVSLWAGEQFAADLSLTMPGLNIVTMSANKVLGLVGQHFPVPQIGHPFAADTEHLQFKNCLVLLVSHSGGTFSSLAVANLMRAFTSHIFVVTSEWDTQEAAGYFSAYEVAQLEGLNVACISALEDIVGVDREHRSVAMERPDAACHALRRQGATWAQHVLEAPVVWIMAAMYIFLTVAFGLPPATILSSVIMGVPMSDRPMYVSIISGAVDAVLYIFLPLWMSILLRLWEGRHPMHRLGTRTVVVGDVPWVAQSIEAFLSKLFACSYSIASLNVVSGNPVDHFVHRHTHRVVRGSLLAVGRPDGRLNALVTAEGGVNLSVNQASSIQSYGVRCESVTIGHNPSKLNSRKRFICERQSGGNLLSKLYTLHSKSVQKKLEALKDENDNITLLSRLKSSVSSQALNKVSSNQQLKPADEEYIGEQMTERFSDLSEVALMQRQSTIQHLYESRMASLQRLVAFMVMFHEMGQRVQDFWPRVSFGMLGYKMDRTHSIMRIATTASPIPASDVRGRMKEIVEAASLRKAEIIIRDALLKFRRVRASKRQNQQAETTKKSGEP
eukprot:gene9250-10957_t